MSIEPFEVFAIRYAHLGNRHPGENFALADPHEFASDLDYFVWVARRSDCSFVIDTGFAEEAAIRRGRELLRHPVYTRFLHWMVGIFFFLALLSGFGIYLPWIFRFFTPLFGGGAMTRLLHPWFGLGFVFFFALQAINWLQVMKCGACVDWVSAVVPAANAASQSALANRIAL